MRGTDPVWPMPKTSGYRGKPTLRSPTDFREQVTVLTIFRHFCVPGRLTVPRSDRTGLLVPEEILQ